MFRRLITLCLLVACTQSPIAHSYTSSPWLVESRSFAMISFSLHPDDVRPHLPAGLAPQINDKNRVTCILEVYATERIAGLPNYTMAFLVVEIAGHPSRTGTPGHFAIWGRLDSPASLDFFAQQLGFPYRLASRLDIQVSQNSHRTLIADTSGDLLDFQLEPIRESPVTTQGVVDMLVFKTGEELMKAEVPYLTAGYLAKVGSFKVLTKRDPLLNLLTEAAVDWALVSNQQIFTYSPLISALNNRGPAQNTTDANRSPEP